MAENLDKSMQEINELDLAGLVELLENLKQDSLNARFKLATGQLTDTASMRTRLSCASGSAVWMGSTMAASRRPIRSCTAGALPR